MNKYGFTKKQLRWIEYSAWLILLTTIAVTIGNLNRHTTEETSALEGVFVGSALWVSGALFFGMGAVVYILKKLGRPSPVVPGKYLVMAILPFFITMHIEGAGHLINEYADQSEGYTRYCAIQGYSELSSKKTSLTFSDCPKVTVPNSVKNDVVVRKARTAILFLRKGALGKEWLQTVSVE
jgi:hypothetical protein